MNSNITKIFKKLEKKCHNKYKIVCFQRSVVRHGGMQRFWGQKVKSVRQKIGQAKNRIKKTDRTNIIATNFVWEQLINIASIKNSFNKKLNYKQKIDEKTANTWLSICAILSKNTFQSRKDIHWSKRMIKNFSGSQKISSHVNFNLSLLCQNGVWTNSTSGKNKS